jgi:hypothetical protein
MLPTLHCQSISIWQWQCSEPRDTYDCPSSIYHNHWVIISYGSDGWLLGLSWVENSCEGIGVSLHLESLRVEVAPSNFGPVSRGAMHHVGLTYVQFFRLNREKLTLLKTYESYIRSDPSTTPLSFHSPGLRTSIIMASVWTTSSWNSGITNSLPFFCHSLRGKLAWPTILIYPIL